jgi:hypothetical protein
MIDNNLSAADSFGLIADKFVNAIRQGKRPTVEEYAHRYPEHADEIREVLPALVMIERAKDEDLPRERRAADVAESPPIKQLGDYQILREVARGGMGVVY